MSVATIGIFGIVILLILLVCRIPVGYVMALVGLVGFGYLVSAEGGLTMAARSCWGSFASYSLSVIPLFVLMGQFAFKAGITRRLYTSIYKWLGNLPGGLAMTTIGACAGFAAICGSSVATTATMTAVALPEMRSYNYSPSLATGTIAAGAGLGILIPPSVILIIYGVMTEQSIGSLFAAGILPGVLQAFLFIITIFLLCQLNPSLGPKGPKTSFKEKLTGMWGGTIETVAIFILVIGGLFAGWFTPTEAGAIGAIAVLLVGIASRQLNWQAFLRSVYDATKISAMIFLIVAGAIIFNRFIAVTRIPFELAEWTVELQLHPFVVMGIIISMYVIGGMFMDALGLILLTVPIFFPVAIALGFDPIWFGVIIVVVTEMGMITPPVGMNVYVLKGAAQDVPLSTIFRGIVPFFLADILFITLLVVAPQIALFLPSFIRY